AVLAGSVFGDHVSPISDTTIMAATGTKCSVVNHIATKLPYALLIAFISCIGFILASFVLNPFIVLLICIGLLYLSLLIIKTFKKV
ncbi:MAG: Na+/H+ antiporter NhaC family protein, partial [Clostridia bacterium]|nr:Na+/H+ antiporter NhaC family protein [Clostridia bacterium]